MEATMEMTSETETKSNLDEMLESYEMLTSFRDGLQTRIERAVAEQATVSEHIFRKVIGEYRRQLEAIDADITPLNADLDEMAKKLEQEREIDSQVLTELKDELSEAEFRGRVGEFNNEAISDACSRILPRIEDKKRRVSQLDEQIETLSGRGILATKESTDERPQTDAVPPATELEAPVESAVPEVAEPASVTPTPKPAGAPAAQNHSIESSYAPAPVNLPETPAQEDEIDDPLAALADPQPVEPAAAPNSEFLNLIITSDGNAGKRIPLLPMTMSIGREHDNNIELKDPEVARYHARITYCDGHFALENLVGSTGTWVNGESLQVAVLKAGDVIKLGATLINVE